MSEHTVTNRGSPCSHRMLSAHWHWLASFQNRLWILWSILWCTPVMFWALLISIKRKCIQMNTDLWKWFWCDFVCERNVMLERRDAGVVSFVANFPLALIGLTLSKNFSAVRRMGTNRCAERLYENTVECVLASVYVPWIYTNSNACVWD